MYHHLNLKASHTYMFHMLTDGESWWNFLISWIYSQFAKEKVKLITFLRYCMKMMFMLWKHTIVDEYIRFHNWWKCKEANENRAWIAHTFVKTGKFNELAHNQYIIVVDQSVTQEEDPILASVKESNKYRIFFWKI